MLGDLALHWQEEEEEELRRRGRAPQRFSPDRDVRPIASPLLKKPHVRRPSNASTVTWDTDSSSSQGDSENASSSPYTEPTEGTTPPCIGHLPTPRAAPPPLAKATSFASIDEFIDGLPPAPPPPCRLAKQGNKFMKDSLASVTAQQNRLRRSQSAPPARMGCTRHALAIEKAGSPQPVFRTRRARLAPAWEQGAGGIPQCLVYEDAALRPGHTQGSNPELGPGTYGNDRFGALHKDRFGGLAAIGDRAHTLWDMHLF